MNVQLFEVQFRHRRQVRDEKAVEIMRVYQNDFPGCNAIIVGSISTAKT